MIFKLSVLSAIFLCSAFVSSSNLTYAHAFVGVAVNHDRRFETKSRQGTQLHPHRFNGGYDPASPLTWTPQQAAEFTIFHEGAPHHAGMQLRTTIQHWSGADLAEFLTRLYLGQAVYDEKNSGVAFKNRTNIIYEPRNVRTPQWEGLDTREGIFALKDLLKEALSKESLSAQEISRFAEDFLLKEYRWPSQIKQPKSTASSTSFLDSQLGEVVFEQDSFYSLGHARTVARILLAVRKERGYDEYNWNDIALMVTLPEKMGEDREATPMMMIDFFRTISAYTTLTAIDKANIVQRMAMSGWLSGCIPKFMAELFPSETLSENHCVDEMWKLQGDAFFDFPAAATVFEINTKKENEHSSAIAIAVAKVAKAIGKEHNASSSKRTCTAQDTERSEYEELVQSYWKKVEITKTQRKKQTVKGYGVPKTKSIKNRKISDKGYGVSKIESAVDSISI